MLQKLKKSLIGCPVVVKGSYDYFVHPITDGIPRMEPELLEEVVNAIIDVGDFDCNVIVAAEAMGIPLAAAVSLKLGIPYTVIRKREYGLPGEVVLSQHTGYSETKMFINGIKRGERVAIIEDVVSTGGTLKAIVTALRAEVKADVVEIVTVFRKSGGNDELEKELGIPVKTLLTVDVVNGKAVYL